VARIALPTAGELRAGGFANVTIAGTRAQRPVVPQSAILTEGTETYVLTVDSQDIVRRVPITVGSVSGTGVAIADGLTGRERVVVSAGAFLRPGEKVKPMDSRAAVAASAPAPAAGA